MQFWNIIQTQQFNRDSLNHLFSLADAIVQISKSKDGLLFLRKRLAHKRVMLYFSQPSTRTFLSFNTACQLLGMQTSEIRDISISSEIKGESFLDSIRTFSSYVDAIIMRTNQSGQAQGVVNFFESVQLNVSIINAGSGQDQHPTQALLDVYTIERSFAKLGGVDGKTIGFMGDLKRGRTVRSLCYLMKNYKDVQLVFIAPSIFQMGYDILEYLKKKNINYTLTQDLKEVLPKLDVLYVTRLQDEHDYDFKSSSVNMSEFKLKQKHLEFMKSESIILHPFPRRDEIDVSIDLDPRAKYWIQERNGMWVRTALLATIFQVQSEILEKVGR